MVDGLILFCIEDADRLVAAARERRLPFVTMAFGDTDDDVSVVGVDDVAGARLAAGHLTGLGHRRFAILSMEFGEDSAGRVTMERVRNADYATSRLRVEGYFEALAAAGIDTGGVPIFETTADPATSTQRSRSFSPSPSRRPRCWRNPTASPCARWSGSRRAASRSRAGSR